MKITAKVDSIKRPLMIILRDRGVSARLTEDGMVVELPKSGDIPGIYEIPPEITDATLLIEAAESGGKKTDSDSATVVCGTDGDALRPYSKPDTKHSIHLAQAYFAVPSAVVTITGYGTDACVIIKKHQIVRDDNVARIQTDRVWGGEMEKLSPIFSHFQPAAAAALAKSKCRYCCHVHFAKDTKE